MKYRGVVEIAKNGKTYRLRWMIPPDGVYLGLGILQEDQLAVSYFGHIAGVIVYKVEKSRLAGQWTVVGDDGDVYSEVLTKIKVSPGQTPPHIAPQKEKPPRPRSKV